ncbi:hypothetical protein ACWGIV_28225 [Streptomyces sp. NPDC054844]
MRSICWKWRNVTAPAVSLAMAVGVVGLSATSAHADAWNRTCGSYASTKDPDGRSVYAQMSDMDTYHYGSVRFEAYGEIVTMNSETGRKTDVEIVWWQGSDTSNARHYAWTLSGSQYKQVDMEIPEGATVNVSMGVTSGGIASCTGKA